ncbi:DUF262 domain-containing protein [Spirulina major CS-329]|uniref:DUF262 domain-containing protein n=1 Tax=Spirulina TaxID=1154 RepID=UPI00232EC71E|nr:MULTISPECIES: DUF262 domain-containing protein [Spirulina]MDB9493100.1 DUF262 domain-containing protein [Spirulina subsalsa CS-330]MDB9503092.1 DUF262 domain-containing protein [Spirulina major CS-329]
MTVSANKRLYLKAESYTVEQLIHQVKRGLIRVPDFQRPLRWEPEDVKLFFDSVYQGYPVGSFLMRQAHASASVIRYGPVKINASESNAAFWVVDGQQRLTALTAGLARDKEMPVTPDDPWVLYFDAAKQTFHTPPRRGILSSTWVPITQLLDASTLSEWVFNWNHAQDSNLRKSVFEAGSRIRQYEIPLYIVETDDKQLLRDIFYRMNDSGKRMKWEDVHDALFGHKSEEPSTLSALADQLNDLGVGRPSENQLLSAIMAFKDLDVTRSVSEHYRREPEVLRDAVRDALPALRQVLSFLKAHAEIPHLRLLPRSLPFSVLTKFFGFHPEPNDRTIDLLIRWTWRTLLGIKSVDERTLLRHSLDAITSDDAEQTMQKLLSEIPNTRESSFILPQKFDARAADSRVVLVALNSLHPLNPDNGKPLDIADMIEEYDRKAFHEIISNYSSVKTNSPANRILLPPDIRRIQEKLIDLIHREGLNSKILQSHCIDREAAEFLHSGNFDQFLSRRSEILTETTNVLGSRLAAWEKSDRPSISYILQQTGEEE